MSRTSKETLKGYFKAGSIPTESNFTDLVDSFLITDTSGNVEVTATSPGKPDAARPGFINKEALTIGQPADEVDGTAKGVYAIKFRGYEDWGHDTVAAKITAERTFPTTSG